MNILVIGCGRVGVRLAGTLARRGDTVTVIDRREAALARLPDAPGIHPIHGDAADRAVLDRAGIATADALAVVTGSDELNAVLARAAAAIFGVPRVVARLYDPGKSEIHRRLGVQTVAPIIWGARRFADLLTLSEVTPGASIGTGEAELVDVRISGLLTGHRASELSIPGEAHLVALTRDGHTSLAPPASVSLRAGDTVHLAVTSPTRLRVLLGHWEEAS